MSDIVSELFMRRQMNQSKLLQYGFEQHQTDYVYQTNLTTSQFQLTITVNAAGRVTTQVIDPTTGDEYTLHLNPAATGEFVGQVKQEYETILRQVAAQCFDQHVFESPQAQELIQAVHEQYGDELEFLWRRFPQNAIWRRSDTNKWYAAILTVDQQKLGLKTSQEVEVLDIRVAPEQLATLVDQQRYFPGYHMNKKSWMTVILNGSLPTEKLLELVAASYQRATK